MATPSESMNLRIRLQGSFSNLRAIEAVQRIDYSSWGKELLNGTVG
jgi:hypothetical protein